jgi:outer membrane receptor for ferrienterochelin and colicin
MSRPNAVYALVIWLALSGSALAQQGFSELRGRVVDQQGSVLPGVPVVLRHQESGMFRETVSGGDGSFFFGAMTPGVYEVMAELSGFKKYLQRDVRLEVGRQSAIEIRLEVGGLEESVTVTAEAPLVDTSSKEIGGVVNSQELADTPAFNRNFTAYLGLMPGVVAGISTASFGADSINVNGQSVQNVNYTFDGSNNNDTFNGGNGGAQARIPVEAVQEFQLLTSQFDAEHGAASGAVVNAVSKQGTNAFRGSAFAFYQDDAMTTRDFFARLNDLEKPETRQQQWGGTLGGPIVRDKAHFFASVERIVQDAGVTVNIPAQPQFNTTTFEETRVWNLMARVDHQLNSNHTWGLRFLLDNSPQANQMSTNWTPERNEQETDTDQTLVATLNSVIGSTKVNTLRISGTQEDVNFGNPGYFANGGRQDLLDPTLDYQTFDAGPSNRHSRRLDRAIFADETFAWFVADKGGDHDLKFGAQYFWASLFFQAAGNLNGEFFFPNNNYPFNPADPTSYPERFTIRVPNALESYMKGHFISTFAQDRWRLNNRLTLSLGLRYDLEVLPLPERENPFGGTSANYPVDKNNFSPRVGFSYALDDQSQSALRGGFGVFYQRSPYTYIDEVVFQGVFADSFTATFPRTGIDRGPSRGQFPTDPFLINGPILNRDLLNAMFPAGTRGRNAGTVHIDNPDRTLPFARQYSLGYERQLPGNMSLSLDLIRSEQRQLLLRRDLNPGLRETTARGDDIIRPDPSFVAILQGLNLGWSDYTALQVQLDKRLSRGVSLRGSYSFSRTYGNTDGGTPETIFSQLGDDLRLEQMEGLADTDRPHIMSINGTVNVPHTGGLKVSGVVQYRSSTPMTLGNSTFDLDRNGTTANEYLPAGTYTGEGPNAVTVDFNGERNGARASGYFRIDMRAGYRVRLPGGRTIDAFLDLFNLNNHVNYGEPAGDQRSRSTFLVRRTTIAPVRTVQLNFRYGF